MNKYALYSTIGRVVIALAATPAYAQTLAEDKTKTVQANCEADKVADYFVLVKDGYTVGVDYTHGGDFFRVYNGENLEALASDFPTQCFLDISYCSIDDKIDTLTVKDHHYQKKGGNFYEGSIELKGFEKEIME